MKYEKQDQRRVDYSLEVIWNVFWIPVSLQCLHTVTAGLHVEQVHCAHLQLYLYNGRY